MTALGLDSDPRPEAPTYSVIDATGWTAEELAELRYADDETDEQYRADLAAWEERQAAVAAGVGSVVRADGSRDAMRTPSNQPARRYTREGAHTMNTTKTATLPTPTVAGESIRTLRALAGMSLDDLASRVPSSRDYLEKVENGTASPTRYWVGNVVGIIADVLAASHVRPEVFTKRKQHAEAVRHALSEHRVSIAEAARVVGVSASTMRRRLNAQGPFYVAELMHLAEHMNMSIVDFFPES